MGEPTEPTPAIHAGTEEPSAAPVSARSTEHPWEEPALLPAPSMFLGAPPAPTRGRHVRRRHPVALVGTAAAAALLLGASAVALIDVAQNGPAGAGVGSGGIAQAAGPAGTGEQGVGGGGGAGGSKGTGHQLVNARAVHTVGAALPSAASGTYAAAPIGAAFAGHSPTAGVPNHRVATPTTTPFASAGAARATGRATPPSGRGSGSPSAAPSRAPSGSPSSHVVVPTPPRSSAVPSYQPTVPGRPTTEPTTDPSSAPHSKPPVAKPPVAKPAPHSKPPTAKPVPSAPSSVPPVETPTSPSSPPAVSVPPVTVPPVPSSLPVPVPDPLATDSGLHKALGHATPAPGIAAGHTKSPANPDATSPSNAPLLPGADPSASPTASLAE